MKRLLAFLTATVVFAVTFWSASLATEAALAAPAAPSGFQVSSYSASQINLSWSAVTGATSYQVYRSTGTSTSYTKIATVTTRSYKNTGLTAAARYNYKVRAVQGSTAGSFTAVKTAYTRPSVPTGLAAKTLSTSQIDLSWTVVTGATSYQVYRSTGTSTTYAKIATVTTPKYSDKGRAAGTRYNYKVCAANSGGAGGFTAVKTAYTKPAAPSGLAAKAISTTQIDLSWTATTGATSYQVYRSTGTSTTYAKIATVTTPKYSDKGRSAGTRYNYKVLATNAGGTGSFSAVKTAYTKPTVPTALKAAAQSSSSIKLTWTAVTGATKYIVYRSASATGTFAKVGEATAATYTSTGLAANTTYYYKVSAVNAGGEGAMSAAASAKTLVVKPAAPAGLAAAAQSSSSIKLTWPAVAGATKYIVYRSASATGTFAKVGEATAATYTNTGLAASTTYYYKVSAVNAGGEGAMSAAASAKTLVVKPAAPAGLAAAAQSSSSIKLTWTAVTGATKYIVYRCATATGTFAKVGEATAATYTSTGLAANTTYYYKVSAVNAGGEGAMSAAASAKTLMAKPAAPAGLAAAAQSSSSIKLTWTAVAGATKYFVYSCATATGTFAKVGEATAATYMNSGLAASTTYYYKVSAVNAGGEGAMSAAASAKTPAPSLPAPTWISATTVDYDSINLKWNTVAGAAKYYIYVSTNASSGYSLLGEWVGTDCNANGLNANTAYFFMLSAVDANGKEGTKSIFIGATTAPAPPKPAKPTFTCTGSENNGVIYFKPSTTGYYKVYDSTNGVTWSQVLMNGSYDEVMITSYYGMNYVADVVGQSIYVRFVAVNGPTQSDPDDHYFAALGMPQFSSRKTYWDLVIGHTGAIDLFWNAVPGASGYRIVVKDLQGNTIRSTTWTATSIRFTNMPSYVTLNYYIVAYNSQGVSGPIYHMEPISIVGESGGW